MKNLIALDVGAKIIGVAASTGSVAFPREEIRWGGNLAILREALDGLKASTVVLGRPYKASEGMQEALETVAAEIERRGLPIVYMDEHVSTQEAANRIADIEEETGATFSGRRDSVAAQIILERYLAQS